VKLLLNYAPVSVGRRQTFCEDMQKELKLIILEYALSKRSFEVLNFEAVVEKNFFGSKVLVINLDPKTSYTERNFSSFSLVSPASKRSRIVN
jgi:hypothetical protein